MCGRYVLHAPVEALEACFEAVFRGAPGSLRPAFNIAPTDSVGVVKALPEGRVLTLHRWGLVPAWAKDPAMGGRLINARAESAAEKPSFRAAFRRRRCLLPASGFYEWQVRAGGLRQPHLIRSASGDTLALAGLWDRWEGPSGPLDTCTILTTAANAFMAPLHDRMPVILEPGDWGLWLDPATGDAPADRERLQALLRPCAPERLRAHPVSPRVGSVRFQGPACMEPFND